jgi:RimJ/RimL family protein N-acetyltransferase
VTRVTVPSGGPFVGRHLRLDLLDEADVEELGALLRDPHIYAHGYRMHRQPTAAADARELARQRFLAGQGQADGHGGGRTAYAIRLVSDGDLGSAGALVGTSALVEAHLANQSIHLGSTLYGRRWWGTAVNAEAKLLLLSHCFDDCGYGRVKIQTDAVNGRSLAAIERLGARREGVLRRDVRRDDGTFRDTVVFSVLAEEWPAVKANLIARLIQRGTAAP